MGYPTGIDLDRLLASAGAAQDVLGRPLGSRLLAAGAVDWRRAGANLRRERRRTP
jgi:hydroxymethylglutaryl-CoA lyase